MSKIYIEDGATPPDRLPPSSIPHASHPKSRKALFFSPGKSPAQKEAHRLLKRARWSPRYMCSPKRGKKQRKWTDQEKGAAVMYVALHKDQQPTDTTWPAMTADSPYWQEAVQYVARTTNMSPRKASAIRTLVTKEFVQRYKTLEEAEEAFDLDLDHYAGLRTKTDSVKLPDCKTPTSFNIVSLIKALSMLSFSDLNNVLTSFFASLSSNNLVALLTNTLLNIPELAVVVMNKTFTKLGRSHHCLKLDFSDYISHSYNAMKALQSQNKPNSLYRLSTILAMKKITLERMPWPLIQYQIDFFFASHINQITIPEELYQWTETMTSQGRGSGTILKVLSGPMWSGMKRKDVGKTEMARVNIACPSYSSLQSRLKKSEFLSKPEVQMASLKSLDINGRYWIKLDGTDIKSGILESVNGVWSGDVDLGDGQLQEIREAYDSRLLLIEHFTTGPVPTDIDMAEHLLSLIHLAEEDVSYLTDKYTTAAQTYHDKLRAKNTTQGVLKEWAWECVECSELLLHAQQFVKKYGSLTNMLDRDRACVYNVVTHLRQLKADLRQFVRNLFKKKRKVATHILVIMVSDEQRNKKPYAIPVKYVPYHSLRDQHVRELIADVKRAMMNCGLHVVGTVTDGEFHTLRCKGTTRGLHLWQLIHDCRDSVTKMKKETLMAMMTLDLVDPATGEMTAAFPNDVIPKEILLEMHSLCHTNTFEDALAIVRRNLVPPNYEPYSFRNYIPENVLDMLRSVVATYKLRRVIKDLQAVGVDFTTHLYVPEIDSITGEYIHERGDHNHILKRIASSTRELKNQELNPDAFDAALLDKNTGLTHAALVGARKQSVQDAERLLSFAMANFMARSGYHTEAEYIRHVADWHESSDGRSIHQLHRCKSNYLMLNYILDKWMPWHRDCYDFSLIDINRPTDNIRGFTYQTLIEITTNIESQELRRLENGSIGHPEHPRAGTTDDNECFFSIVRRHLGGSFTLMEFESTFPRLAREFAKRTDQNLPFYYWTINERYTLEYPGFDEVPYENTDCVDHGYAHPDPQQNPSRLKRLVRNAREDTTIITAGRAFLPARHRPHLRERLYRHDVGLPPVPTNTLPLN